MVFPFVAVEGQEDIKKALILNIINPEIGGVLIAGEKGTAKSTLVRGIESLSCGMKVINLPLNTTEDNLIGSIDVEKTLKIGKKIFQEGLLKKCHGNILYIDEVNLLGTSLISNIVEVASREVNYVEREGISFFHECRFIIIGTMNPEEGQLKSTFLDKFGLYVNVKGSHDIMERVKIIKKRLEFEKNPKGFKNRYLENEAILKEKIERAQENIKKIKISDRILNIGIEIIKEANTQGNRAEIIIIETAKAIAAFDGRNYVNIDDLKEAAIFVLPHRINPKNNENEFPENGVSSKENEKQDESSKEEKSKINSSNEGPEDERKENQEEKNNNELSSSEETFDIGEIFKVKEISVPPQDTKKRAGMGKRCKTNTNSTQGRYIKSTFPRNKIRDFAFDATIRAAAPFQKNFKKKDLKINIQKEHIRVKIRERRIGTTILFVVDASGSMGVKKRMEAVKGTIFSLLKDAYEKRDKVGLISFRKDRAEEILPITRSVELAQKKLKKLVTGGKTPLNAGLYKAYAIIKKEKKRDKDLIPLIIFLSDGRGNISSSGKEVTREMKEIAQKIKSDKIRTLVVDTEEGFVKLEMAKILSEALGAEYCKLENLKSKNIVDLVNIKK